MRVFGARGVVATGLVLLSFAGFLGATTGADSGYGLTATWLTVTGLGAGLAMVPAMDGALAALPPDRSGIGSGLLMTVRQVGSAIGVALLGSLLAQGYRSRVDTERLPAEAADTARESVVAAHLVAQRLAGAGGARRGSAAELVASADAAFTHGMSLTLFVSGAIALPAALLAALLLPRAAHHGDGEVHGAPGEAHTGEQARVQDEPGTVRAEAQGVGQGVGQGGVRGDVRSEGRGEGRPREGAEGRADAEGGRLAAVESDRAE